MRCHCALSGVYLVIDKALLFVTGTDVGQGSDMGADLFNVHSGDSLCVGENLLVRLPVEQLDALVPLVHIVRVLPQHHAAEKDGPPLHKMLQPRQSAQGRSMTMTGLVQLDKALSRAMRGCPSDAKS